MEDRDNANAVRRAVSPSGQSTDARSLGDPAAWVDEHGDALFRYALLRVRERATAEDVVQETFLAAVKSMSQFHRGSEVRTWLIGILRHKISDHFRKHGREVQVDAPDDADPVVDGWFDQRGFWLTHPKSWEVNPAELAERQEFWLVLQSCIDALPGRAAEAFSLRVVNDTEPDDACKVLGVTTTYLWVLLHRARARLRACLEVKWFGRQTKESA
jgi:RNA polymerase sigma-70 factor (ECF subfamily)